MIKKIFKSLLTFCIVGLGIINFSIAGCQYFDLDLQEQMTDQNKNGLTLKSNGNFLTNGQYKFVNVKVNSSFVYNYFWLEDGFYQLFKYNSNYVQGFNNNWCLINNVNDGSSCSAYSCSPTNSNLFGNFYNDPVYSNPDGLYLQWGNGQSSFCFVYNNLNQMVCSYYLGRPNDLYGSSMSGSLGFNSQIQNVEDFANSDIKNYVVNSPLGGNGGGGEGGEEDGGDDNSTVISTDEGVIYATCNRGTAVRRYEKNGFNVRLCYGGLDNYDIWTGGTVGTLPIYGTGKDFRDIWNNTQNYYQLGTTGDNQNLLAWFSYRRQLYDIYKRGGYSTNPFVNTPLVMFTYFGAIDVYGNSKNNRDILEYCNLKLYVSDYSVEYKGVNENSVCSLTNLVEDSLNDVSDRVDDLVNGTGGSQGTGGTGGTGGNIVSSGTIIGFNTNDIFSGSQGSGGTGGSEGDNGNLGNTIVDGRDFITQFVDDFKQNIGNLGNNGNGFLPGYIIVALMGIVLFNFLRH